MAKYIANVGGNLTEIEAIDTSTGAGDAGKIIETDSGGKIDESFMPIGIGADIAVIEADVNISAGDYVNIFNDSGPKVRLADASNNRPAHGFVLAGVTAPANATVYFRGTNDELSGLTPGATYFLSDSSAGDVTATAPSGSGEIVQKLGVAVSATEIQTDIKQTITLA